jgi:hypothetical protein
MAQNVPEKINPLAWMFVVVIILFIFCVAGCIVNGCTEKSIVELPNLTPLSNKLDNHDIASNYNLR